MQSLLLILLLTCCTPVVYGGEEVLQCFSCGLYIPPEPLHLNPGVLAGKIYPCENLTRSHLKDCKPTERFCMKYVNAGLVVHSCAEQCVEDVNDYSEREIHCCSDDACNASIPSLKPSSLIPPFVSLISLILTSVWCYGT